MDPREKQETLEEIIEEMRKIWRDPSTPPRQKVAAGHLVREIIMGKANQEEAAPDVVSEAA